ncbi:MAG: acyltransferase [Solirubrobacteraceae bacterium]|nr:acyltransferase [Solirubrobacteraceae bacterium]
MTVVRGLGALIVVIGHVALQHPFSSSAWNGGMDDLLEPLAIAGVSGFFTLSGFVLTWTIAGQSTAARDFWRKRFARLYPVHAATWGLAFLTLLAAGVHPALWKMLPSLLLLNVWVPNLEIFWGPNTPAWTLSAEAFFYLLFPLLLPLAWKIRERHLLRVAAGLIAITWLWAGVVYAAVPPTHMLDDGTAFSRLQYFAIVVVAPVRLLDFAVGMILARIVIAGRVPSRLHFLTYASIAVGYVVARWVIPQPYGFVCALAPAVAIGMIYSARADLEGKKSLWPQRFLHWVGRISFSLYMVHWPVVYGGYLLMGQPALSVPEVLLMTIVMLAVSLGLAWLLHTRIEVPAYRKLAPRRQSATPAADAAEPRKGSWRKRAARGAASGIVASPPDGPAAGSASDEPGRPARSRA